MIASNWKEDEEISSPGYPGDLFDQRIAIEVC